MSNGGVGGVVEFSNGGMVVLSNLRIVELVEMWNRRMANWWSWWPELSNRRFVEYVRGMVELSIRRIVNKTRSDKRSPLFLLDI